MDQRTTGLILRVRPLTETSLIVQWLTREFGRIHTVAKGARRPKSPFAGKLDLFYLADISFNPSRRGELHTLREVSVRDFHPSIRRELGHLQLAAYFSQLVEQATEVNTPLPGLFELFAQTLRSLPDCLPAALTVCAFEVKLLAELGLNPTSSETALTPDSNEVLNLLETSDWTIISRLRLTESQAGEINHFLRGFLTYHLGKTLKARAAAVGAWS